MASVARDIALFGEFVERLGVVLSGDAEWRLFEISTTRVGLVVFESEFSVEVRDRFGDLFPLAVRENVILSEGQKRNVFQVGEIT
ncbi:MAG: hypothetical protein VYE40_05875, partial [Myxococcota bacterium]|nr:hypothetical protein [Myxococcota bacterium]